MTWYEEDSNILYILGSEITGTHTVNGTGCKIYSAIPDLMICGGYEMTGAEAAYGFYSASDVTLEDSFTFIGTNCGVKSDGDLTFNGGDNICTGGDYGIFTDGTLTITDGIHSVRSNGAVYYHNSITLGDMISVTNPESVIVTDHTIMSNGSMATAVTFEMVSTVIDTVAITDIDAPVAGAYPSTTPMGGEGYNITAQWTDADTGDWVTDSFEAGHQYTVILDVDSSYGYEFAENLTATVNGEPANVGLRDGFEPEQARRVTYVFPRIDAGGQSDEVITSFNITNVNFPYAGRAWDYQATVPDTMTLDSVKLYDSYGVEIARGTALTKNENYYGEVTVTANEGYCFEYDFNGWNVYPRVNFTNGEGVWASAMQNEQSMSGSSGTGKTVTLRWRMKPTEDAPALIGDANGDGKINVLDVTAIQRHIAELEPLTGTNLINADTDGDGSVTIDDVTLLLQYIAEFDVTLGA